jgi:uncharacterized membrane protein
MVGTYVGRNHKAHGFLLNEGVFITVDVPGTNDTRALGINNRAQIVGVYSDSNESHGFLWEKGVFTKIDAPGAAFVTATSDINNKGQIVGFHDGSSTGRTSFLLEDGEFIFLNFPGARDTSALGINDRGEIVGEYFTGVATNGFIAAPKKMR